MRIRTPQQQKKILWKVFSEYIRRRDKGRCFSCGGHFDWKYEMDAGHYKEKSSNGLLLYFDERNVNAQCKRCNKYLNGNLTLYALHLLKKYGDEILKELEKLRWKVVKDYPFEAKIEYYKQEIMRLQRTS